MARELKILKNYILYFLIGIAICLIGASNVFAYSYTSIGDQADITVVLVSTAYGSQPFNVPKNSGYNFNEVLQVDYLINNYNFEANKHYQLESHLTSQTLTNANKYIVTGLNGEQCLTDYSSSIFTGSYPRWDFQCPHATSSVTITISNNANQYLWNNGVYTWTTALLKYSAESIPVSSDTQDIINNQTQNTQNIINNQNQNTQEIIESNKVCTNISKYDREYTGYLYDNGQVGSNDNTSVVTKYFSVDSNSTLIKVEDPLMTGPAYRICFYNGSKVFISCLVRQDYYSVETIPIPDNASYVRFTINISDNVPKFKICKNGNQAATDAINGLNDSLNDDNTSDATDEASDFFSDFSTNTFGLTGIITAPLNLINSLLSQTCAPLHLPLPYLNNKYLDLPCMSDIYGRFGAILSIYQTITYGIIAYWVCVRIFNQVKDFKNPEHDEIEVLDL